MEEEKLLSFLYFFSTLSGFLGSLCMGIAWSYWQRALDSCVGNNCGCILYGKWTFSTFYGGDLLKCHYVTFCQVPVIVITFSFFMYHICHVCIPSTQYKKVILREPNKKRTVKKERIVRTSWYYLVPATFVAIAAIFIFSCGILITDGYYKTCSQYRKNVVSGLSATGNLAVLINNRMACISVYDFIDYLQPDPPTLEPKYLRGSWKINTGILLNLTILAVWMNFILLVILFAYNIKQGLSRRKPKPKKKMLEETDF